MTKSNFFGFRHGTRLAAAAGILAVLMASALSAQVPSSRSGTFTDSRDGQVYRTVTIGTQTWMAENLNWAGDNGDLGRCYNNVPDSCAKYGRLYDWSTAMDLPSSCNTTSCDSLIKLFVHQGICPPGWHVPNDVAWKDLIFFVDGGPTTGTKLKTKSGWAASYDHIPAGTNDFGFSALPGGRWDDGFGSAGSFGLWWSDLEDSDNRAGGWFVRWDHNDVDDIRPTKDRGYSVRCVRD